MRLVSRFNNKETYKGRYWLPVLVLVLVFFVLTFRLAYLQLNKGEYYNILSQDNYIQERRLPAIRGEVLDCKGRLLAGDRPSYNVYITPAFVSQVQETVVKLEGVLNLSPVEVAELEDLLMRSRGASRYQQMLLDVDISREQVALLAAEKLELPGVEVLPAPGRHYPYGELTAHLTGYLARINNRELESLKSKGYSRNDKIGKWGLEKKYEARLRGRDGRKMRVVDARGRVKGLKETELIVGPVKEIQPEVGQTVRTTIDIELQQAAQDAFNHEAGAVVAMEVNTGRILVYYSKPAFDPNMFVRGFGRSEWRRLNDSILDPMLDKVSQAAYYPGSTYKPIPAVAAMEEKVVEPKTIFYCPGYRSVGDRVFHCWKRSGHGYQSLPMALQNSCDVYFYEVGELLGAENIWKWAKNFGLGQHTGIEFNRESAGVLPDLEYHKRVHRRRWFVGDTMSHVIGQGDTKTTPLQLAVLYAAIANGGNIFKPMIVEGLSTSNGKPLETYSPSIRWQVEADDFTWDIVRQGLDRVVNHPKGTAHSSALEEPKFAGKTGTAQVARLPKNRRRRDKYLLKDHALFAAYAPVENPQITVIVVIEHGESGSGAAAPVAKKVVKRWWELYGDSYVPPEKTEENTPQ